jgi:hypothetical protein
MNNGLDNELVDLCTSNNLSLGALQIPHWSSCIILLLAIIIASATISKMNNISDNELLNLCASNDLSLGALQETINFLGPRVSSQNPSCFHKACMNKNVTLEIVQLLYDTFPEVLRLCGISVLNLERSRFLEHLIC